jgi:hypothetical protein
VDDWKFYIVSPKNEVLKFCQNRLDQGYGSGYDSGYGDGDGRGYGFGDGYGCDWSDGWGDGYYGEGKGSTFWG